MLALDIPLLVLTDRIQVLLVFTAYGVVGASSQYENSIVLTTIQYPTPSVKRLAALPNWQLIVVGDVKTPPDWSLHGAEFLSHDTQSRLGYEILKDNLTPDNSYARKNVGYLWAIAHGAKLIYETDDDNLLTTTDIAVLPSPGTHAVYQTTNATVNVYSHFRQANLWPRGFPLEDIVKPSPQSFVRDIARPLIQQSLADVDPDVDAIHRLTQPLGITFDSAAFSVLLPGGSFCPFNSQNTLFLEEALWGMLIPVSTAFRVCDIWRGYWSQRLLWDIGGLLSFGAPTVEQHRNAHNILLDFIDEADLYGKAGKLVKFLAAWDSKTHSLGQRMIELADAMVTAEFWGQRDSSLMKAWVADLTAAGYHFPPLLAPGADSQLKVMEDSVGNVPHAHHYPVSWHRYPDIILVVMFNKAYSGYKSTASLLHNMYMPVFGHVVFTGQHVPDGLQKDIAWVPCTNASGGQLMHKCLGHVMEMYPMTDATPAGGYLMIGDDTIFDNCAMQGMNRSKIWYQHAHHHLATIRQYKDLQREAAAGHWHWNTSFNGGKALGLELHDAVVSLNGLSRTAAEKQGVLAGNANNDFAAYYGGGYTDFFYVPSRYASQFIYLAYHFFEHPVHHEAAIPFILRILATGLDEFERFHAPIPHLWLHLQQKGLQVADEPASVMLDGGRLMNNSVFVHPVKLSDANVREHFVQWWLHASCKA
ncbi:TPA: hypothetical protein ACH3X2_002525 [Trebouxia sp. C0005]